MPEARGGLHRRIALETPEHVRLEYQLADLGSRAAALALDLAIIVTTILLLVLVLRFTGALGGAGAGFGTAVLYIVLFFATWGYFLFFEAVWDGRTPGKRALGLRVLHDGGEPLSFQGSVLRNLIRFVDLQPGVTGMAGAATILFNRRAQRLGDIVAGTIVVRDTGGGEMFGDEVEVSGRPTRPTLSPEQFELLAGYMARREGLEPGVRARVASSVWGALRESVGGDLAESEADPDARLAHVHGAEALPARRGPRRGESPGGGDGSGAAGGVGGVHRAGGEGTRPRPGGAHRRGSPGVRASLPRCDGGSGSRPNLRRLAGDDGGGGAVGRLGAQPPLPGEGAGGGPARALGRPRVPAGGAAPPLACAAGRAPALRSHAGLVRRRP